ncbi:hypothetical protein [Aestuariicoccus sp. MJ-SS9]|uniref:hypothetical protein n=1 Tax=Aestuariicoccus sp. MJ-SS9 TaxID=3079855 RepID=UPI00290D066B|nr:hypothetical protein [Aestuariicoccus sp. MJ-SS9]MDU8912132.1 hypothetical protein [Aestuariicoccus sp. MJ-SS9]
MVRRGQGREGGLSHRDLAGRHLDKLPELDGSLLEMSVIETTLARHDIARKLFNASAIGAGPLFAERPGRRVDARSGNLCRGAGAAGGDLGDPRPDRRTDAPVR